MTRRLLVSLVLLFSVLFLPWWVYTPLTILSMLVFPLFWEAVLFFLLSDLLYGAPKSGFGNVVYISFFLALVFITLIEIFKRKLRFYR